MNQNLRILSTMLVLAPACSHPVADYCETSADCSPEKPYCDINGEFAASDFIKRTCIPDPFGDDAGVDANPFDAAPGTLTVVPGGTGSGRIFSSPSGIDCGTTCSAPFSGGTDITLSAEEGSTSSFIQWTGDCQGVGRSCDLAVDGDSTVSAQFNPRGELLGSERYGNANTDVPVAVCFDPTGNYVVAGNFKGSLSLGATPLSSDSNSRDYYLAKYSSSGAHIWSKRFGGSADDDVFDVACDSAGDIVVTGAFGCTFSLFSCIEDSAPLRVSKIRGSNGNEAWSKSYTASIRRHIAKVAIVPDDSIVITGGFLGAIDFGGGTRNSTDDGLDSFLVWLSPSGDHIRTLTFGSTNVDLLSAVAVGDAGVVAVAGIGGAVDFGSGPLTVAGERDAIVAVFSPAGSLVWAKAIPAAPPGDTETVGGVVFLNDGDVVVAGSFGEDLGVGFFHRPFMRRLSSATGEVRWTRVVAPTVTSLVNSIVSDGRDNLVLGGTGTLDMASEVAGWIASFEASAAAQRWSHGFSSTGGGALFPSQQVADVATTQLGSISALHSFDGNLQVGETIHTSAGEFDSLVVRFGP